jgi:death-on-curing protein
VVGRTGLVAALVFLDLNGITVHDREGRLYEAMMALAEHRSDLASLLRELAGTSG